MNCFQKFVSLLSETTNVIQVIRELPLWIAFKNLYLCCLKQPSVCIFAIYSSCELLSKICIFVVWNNQKDDNKAAQAVVNCFQKFVSLLSETTGKCGLHLHYRLWIAFKNLYLCCLKQLDVCSVHKNRKLQAKLQF